MAGRLGWGLADQAVSSVTNFAVGIFVARSLDLTSFGVFGLAWVTYAVVLGLARGLSTDPLVVRYAAGGPGAAWRAAAGPATGTACAVGVAAGTVSVAVGLAAGGELGGAFVALGVVLPAVLLQDAWRFAFFAAGAGRRAFANDVVWGLALVPALGVALATRPSVATFLLAWGAAGSVAAAFGAVQAGVRPRPGSARYWIREHRDLGARYLVENGAQTCSAQLRTYGLGAVSGLAAVGAVRGAEQLLGPFLALLFGLANVTVAEAARVLKDTPERLRGFCVALGAAQAVAALAWGTAFLALVPDHVGRALLGPVWEPAAALVLPATLTAASAGLCTGAAAGLRALAASRRSLRAQLFGSGGHLGCGLVGAAYGGATGSAWGVAIAMFAASFMWWFQLDLGLADHLARLRAAPEPVRSPREEVGAP